MTGNFTRQPGVKGEALTNEGDSFDHFDTCVSEEHKCRIPGGGSLN